MRVEALGATLLVPADYKVSSKSNTGGVEGAVTFTRGGGDGGFVELEWLGQPLQAAESTIAARVRQHMKGGELTQRLKTPERFGRPAQAIAYRLGRNSSPDALEVHAVLLDLGPKTLVVSASGPQAERVLEQALSSLWLDDHGPLREGRSATPERWINADLGVSLSMPVVLDESTTAGQGPILAKQRGADGAKVVVIAVPAGGDLAAAGRRLEAQVPLLGDGAQLRTAGLVERSGRTVHEMETVVAGRRTRQTTWIAGDLRVTVAVSAPEASFDRLRPEFGRVLAETKASAVTPR